MSQVTDIAEKEIQVPITDQVTTTEPDLSFCVFVKSFSQLTNIRNFWRLW
jgi:hypothetical protein